MGTLLAEELVTWLFCWERPWVSGHILAKHAKNVRLWLLFIQTTYQSSKQPWDGRISIQMKSKTASACYENLKSSKLRVLQTHSVHRVHLSPLIYLCCPMRLGSHRKSVQTNIKFMLLAVPRAMKVSLWPMSFMAFASICGIFNRLVHQVSVE